MASNIKPAGTDFGVVIAFLALCQFSTLARSWIDTAATKSHDVGTFLFVSLAALSLGLAVGGIRALVVDEMIFCRVTRPVVDWAKVKTDLDLEIVVILRDNLYRYFQFYANMAVALFAWLVARVVSRLLDGRLCAFRELVVFVVALAGVIVLLLSARDSFMRYSKGLASKGYRQEANGDEQRVS